MCLICFGIELETLTKEIFDNLKNEYKKTMEHLMQDIEQGVEICENIKNYAKDSKGEPQTADLEKAVDGAMRLVNLAKKNLNFTLVKENTKGIMLWANYSMLQDVLFNMFDNSNDAIVSKKEAIKSGEMQNPADGFKVNVRANPNGKLCEIIVEDNGKGILPEHLEEDKGVNVMWFTTKGYQKGTGMGIPMMREFVKHNGGTLNIESEFGKMDMDYIYLALGNG